jgi:hypothetical protein
MPPRTWMTSGSSKQRTTWQTASTSRMWARNWLPSPSPRDAPSTSPAMSTKRIAVGTFRADEASSASVSSRGVGHRDDPDVRLDGAEREVRRLRARARERVEQRRLADVGQTDETDGEGHRTSSSGGRDARGPAREWAEPTRAPCAGPAGLASAPCAWSSPAAPRPTRVASPRRSRRGSASIMVKADGCVALHADVGAYKPLNWMNAPNTVTEHEDRWVVTNPSGERLEIVLEEVLQDLVVARHRAWPHDGRVERELQLLLADHPDHIESGSRRSRASSAPTSARSTSCAAMRRRLGRRRDQAHRGDRRRRAADPLPRAHAARPGARAGARHPRGDRP